MNTIISKDRGDARPTALVASERESFSLRLKAALHNAHYSPDSPTQLAREFNIRFSGQAISPHAVRKWLRGEAIPTQEKLRILARWLGVTAEWLRFDDGSSQMTAERADHLTQSDLQLIMELKQLDENSRRIARETIRLLVRMTHGKH